MISTYNTQTNQLLLTLAGLAVAERFAVVSRISVLAELAVASRCVVPALQANASTDSTRLLIDGHTEPTLSRVTITFTCWEREKQTKISADRRL